VKAFKARLWCWKIAKQLAQVNISEDFEADAESLWDWIDESDDRFDALETSWNARSGQSSITQVLTAAEKAYSFSTKTSKRVVSASTGKKSGSVSVKRPRRKARRDPK